MLQLDDIKQAEKRLRPYVYHTPLVRLYGLDDLLHCQVYVKPECMQITHSFKIRGALNKMLQLSPEDLRKGVVTASSGNHGRGVAYAAKLLGTKATVIIPDHAPAVKVRAVEALGARVIRCEKSKRFAIAEQLRDEEGLCYIHPFDDYDVMAGQGTISLEILHDLSDVTALVVPLGGGGLTSGTATAFKTLSPATKIYACEPERIPRFSVSLKAGTPTTVPLLDTVADGVATLRPGDKTLPIVKSEVDQVLDVPEKFLLPALKVLFEEGKILAEPSSAIGIAAVLGGLVHFQTTDKVVFLISGGNLDMDVVRNLV